MVCKNRGIDGCWGPSWVLITMAPCTTCPRPTLVAVDALPVDFFFRLPSDTRRGEGLIPVWGTESAA